MRNYWLCLCKAVNSRWDKRCWNCGALRVHSEAGQQPINWLLRTRTAYMVKVAAFNVLISLVLSLVVVSLLFFILWLAKIIFP